ncbi:MAG TPA: hypothetical protein VHB97_05280 [Polyangia bacterium]|jgi:hypothetical protein|nr:hypothetical protein [Polyangia bacterium]
MRAVGAIVDEIRTIVAAHNVAEEADGGAYATVEDLAANAARAAERKRSR